MLRSAPRDADGRAVLREASFSRSRFQEDVDFSNVRFEGTTRFEEVRFDGSVDFQRAILDTTSFARATFAGPADFSGSTLGASDFGEATFDNRAHFWSSRIGDAQFARATFAAEADFTSVAFASSVEFYQAHYRGPAYFNECRVAEDAAFDDAVFEDVALYPRAAFERSVSFRGTRFAGVFVLSDARVARGIDMSGASCEGDVFLAGAVLTGSCSFRSARFAKDAVFVGARFDADELDFQDAAFTERVALSGGPSAITCRGTRFLGGANLQLPGATVFLQDAEFAGPSRLVGPDLKVLSVRGARVGELTLANVRLGVCRFADAQGLDSMRIEGDPGLALSPGGWRSTRRQLIAEELAWRVKVQHRRDWRRYAEARGFGQLIADEEPRKPAEIAVIYRGLRKSKEDSADEPGAADFYYGEMEMRRHAAAPNAPGIGARLSFWGERVTLWLYWLTSGYGLRASRAVAALLVSVLVVAVLLWQYGFKPEQSFARALIFSAQSTSGLFRAPATPAFTLTYAGEVLQMLLRLLGPLFIGLALLSLRGRVKR